MLEPPDSIPSEAPTVGDGRYAVATHIGLGGMAVVLLAWDTRDEVWRALKVLSPEAAASRKIRGRFQRELAAVLELDHLHVVRAFDAGEDDRLPWIVMELVQGGTLADWLDEHGPLPPRLAVRAMLEVAAGVAAAHAAGIVHRDIKPHNVLITPEGLCKVTDFGIARVEGDSSTRTGAAIGTLGYMAPEQYRDAARVDQRADVYGLGATLWRLITAGDERDLLLLPRDDELLQRLPAPLVPVVRRCTREEPDDRYADLGAVNTALDQALQQLAPDVGAPPHLGSFRPLDPRFDSPTELGSVAHGLFESNDTWQPATQARSPTAAASSVGALPPGPVEIGVEGVRAGDAYRGPAGPSGPAPSTPSRSVLLGIALAGVLGVASIGGAISYGSVQVGRATDEARRAEVTLVRLALETNLDEEIDALSLGDSALPDHIAALHAAAPGGQVEAAVALADAAELVSQQSLGFGGPEGHHADLFQQRVARLTSARDHHRDARLQWEAVSRSPTGLLASWLGLAHPPPVD